jgi:hypothetical protein
MSEPFVLHLQNVKTGPIRLPVWRSLLIVALAGITIGVCHITPDPNTASQPGVRMVLPEYPWGMLGEPQEISASEKQLLPSDTEFVRMTYHSPKGDRIMASIVLAGGEKRSIHRPEVCLPAQGWYMRGGETIQIPMHEGPAIDAMKLDLQREVDGGPDKRILVKSIFLYWFVGKNCVTPHHWKRVFLTSWDRVFQQLNHRWAYVIVTSMVTEGLVRNGKNEAETLDMLKQFAAEIAPSFMLPIEK